MTSFARRLTWPLALLLGASGCFESQDSGHASGPTAESDSFGRDAGVGGPDTDALSRAHLCPPGEVFTDTPIVPRCVVEQYRPCRMENRDSPFIANAAYAYDDAGRLVKLDRRIAGWNTMEIRYDQGRPTQLRLPDEAPPEVVDCEYEGARVRQCTQMPDGLTTHYLWKDGFLVEEDNARGRRSYDYDELGRLLGSDASHIRYSRSDYEYEGRERYEYDEAGSLVRAVATFDEGAIDRYERSFEYDRRGRLSRIRGTLTHSLGNVTAETDLRFRYRNGRLVRISGSDGRIPLDARLFYDGC